MMCKTVNAGKVFLAGMWVGVVALESYHWFTRDSRDPALIPFRLDSSTYICTADRTAPPQQQCKCTNCGMNSGSMTSPAQTN
jgi:hypothetical protein